ncbi:EAL domain-containing protein [Fundidesulfovibrio terrae]|uniref:EAL domain-containing protein n=1 Tax=Fundidesulfovibrio terrae TaxID=2922866 RepID=UPI001FAE9C53|nr:EAL domain-containing protein [Fundidesulfovibrio terrae]
MRPLYELNKGTLAALEFSFGEAVSGSVQKLDAIVEVLGGHVAPRGPEAFLCVSFGADELADALFPGALAETCSRAGMAPAGLCLFFSDKACLELGIGSLDQFLRFKRLGFRLGLDIASIASMPVLLVERLPADVLRLDILDSMPVDADIDSQRNIADFVAFASNLLMVPAAKGVHDSMQLNRLRDMGIRIGQGPLFADSILIPHL